MGIQSQDVGNHATGHRLVADGLVYEFGVMDDIFLTAYERQNFEAKRDRLRLLRTDYTPEQYAQRLDALAADFHAGKFSLRSDEATRKSQDGVMLILKLLIHVGKEGGKEVGEMRPITLPQLSTLMRKHGPEATQLLKVVQAESFGVTVRDIDEAAEEAAKEAANSGEPAGEKKG